MARKDINGEVLRLQEAQEARQDELLTKANVVGVAVATKFRRGQDTEEPCVAVFVEQKMALEDLAEKDRIPDHIDNKPTDVFETGVIFAGQEMAAAPTLAPPRLEAAGEIGIEALKTRARPVEGGYSVGHHRITAGTYATAVYDMNARPGIPPRYYVLSNNHVLANSNNARIGDPILQPGPYDGGIPGRDTIATLSRFVPIQFGGATNFVDAAIAEGPFHVLDREIYWIGYVQGVNPRPTIGLLVQKTGRTTSYTTGKVTAINATVNVNYGGGQVARFARQIVTGNMSAPGDSGSLVLDMERRAVGLLFAGSSQVTILNPITYVQNQLWLWFW